MAEIKDLKAYVLTIPQSKRLVDGKIAGYPSILPEPNVVYGYTVADGIKAPDWFRSSKDVKHNNYSFRNNNYCVYISHRKAIREHFEKYPDSPLLIMEDDVAFEPNFNEYYTNFIKLVPDDWDAIYFGGWHYNRPKEVKPDVLRGSAIFGLECAILSPKLIIRLLDYLNDESGHKDQVDNILGQWMANSINAYSPIYRFAYQKPGYSFNYNKQFTTDHWRYNCLSYITVNGNLWCSTPNDLARYGEYNPIKDQVVKSYVLTVKDRSRLVDGKIPTFPTIFEEPRIVYGPTVGNEPEPMPSWYKSGASYNRRKIEWCCYLGHLIGLREHLEKYPDCDCLMLEDDVEFNPRFNEYYTTFMRMVPDDWDLINFGGYHYHMPKEVLPNVLKPSTIYGSECILVKSTSVPKLLDHLSNVPPGETRGPIDTVITWANCLNLYTPVAHFANQQYGRSLITNGIRHFNRKDDFSLRHGYYTFDKKVRNASKYDLCRYVDTSDYEKRMKIDVKHNS